jgi:hypothetical protein
MINEGGVVGGMRIVRGTKILRENVPLCPPQISQDLTLDSTRPLQWESDN